MEIDKCRICLEKNAENILLFGQYRNEYNIVDIVYELTSLQIENNDCLPKSLCKLCADKLVDFHIFRQQILDVQNRLHIKNEAIDELHIKDNEIAFVDVKEEELVTQPPPSISSPVNKKEDPTTRIIRQVNRKKVKHKEAIIDDSKLVKPEILSDDEKNTCETIGKKFICDQCSRAFRYPSRFIAHYRNVHLKQYERRICPYCPRAFTLSSSSNSNLRRHIRNIHENYGKEEKYPSIKCNECDIIVWGSLEMYEHSKVHEPNCRERDDGYNLCCDACNIDLKSYNNFMAHMKELHGLINEKELKPVRCRWCGERCKSLQGLFTHIRLVHKCESNIENTVATSDMINMAPIEKSTSFLCTVCGKVLSSQISYKNHMTVHSGEKPFVCDSCPARFSQKFYLNNHKLTHTQERKYTCSECSKAFRQSAHLKSHLKTHGIGIKEKYPCSVCNKEFLFRGTLREHMWVHKEGEVMPHVCIECGKGFLWKNKLEAHMRKGHCK